MRVLLTGIPPGKTPTPDHHQQRLFLYSCEAVEMLGLEKESGDFETGHNLAFAFKAS